MPMRAAVTSASGTLVALGRFSEIHSSPVVPVWQATCMPSALRLSELRSEPAAATMPWLEFR